MIALDRSGTTFGNTMLGTYVAVSLTHLLRHAPRGQPWRHTLCLAGADKLRGEILDRLCDVCETTRTGLVLAYQSIPAQVKERLGRGNAAVAFMRLGNAEDAKAASEQLGTEHRFVMSQLTETIGLSVTDTTSSAYTSTTGSVSSAATSTSVTEGTSRSTGQGRSDGGSPLLPSRATYSRSTQDSDSRSVGESASPAKTSPMTKQPRRNAERRTGLGLNGVGASRRGE